MKILTSLAVMAFAGSLSAQTTYLSEDFNSGVVPPAGWTVVNNNANPLSPGWISSGNRAWHEDEAGGVGQTDNTLISPAMDLTAATAAFLHFDGETNWANYLANHPNSFGNGISNMEVSTDGGATWTVIWTDTSLVSGDTYSPTLDLAAFLGNASVQIGAHFSGDYAQEWWIDNVVVDDNSGAGGLVYSITNLVAGQTATFAVSGATAGGTVILGYSLSGAGPTNTQFGSADMSLPISTLATLTANGSGNASFAPVVPGGAAGATLYTQGLDLASRTLTNSLAELVL
ncbi:MAG: choice-of-anchor J domain-containing protein [Planctomycetota bacterium]|nr:choice-of-anchor J domain-containing protein [Planctomycetota bacterium]MDA1113007.1 choice-of-anchor J domain-containing protein [Planctomycetota bacterium]